MGFSLRKTVGKLGRGIKRKMIDPLHNKSRKFYRKSGLKSAMKLAPMVGMAAGAMISSATGDPRFAQLGAAVGTAAKDALSGDFKKALKVVEDNVSPEMKQGIDSIKQQVESVKSTVNQAIDKADGVIGDVEAVGKSVKDKNIGSALQTVEKYMSPEQKKTLDTALMSGKELTDDAKDLFSNLDKVADKGQDFVNKFNEKKIQISDAVSGDAMLVDGMQGLKTKAKNLVKEGKEKINERIEGVRETMKELGSANLLPAEGSVRDEDGDGFEDTGGSEEVSKDPELTAKVQSLEELNELVNTEKMESEILEEPEEKKSSFSRLLRGED